MNPATILGFGLTTIGIAGYALGLNIAYPGRSFSITLFMIGITLLGIRSVTAKEGSNQ